MSQKFKWDLNKEDKNIIKHGIAFAEAVQCFDDANKLEYIDEKHSAVEDRFFIIGKAESGRIYFVVFTRRGDVCRIISARTASKKERNLYAKK